MVTLTVWLLSGIGLYASAFMYRKAVRAARGELTEPSVVQTPAARTIGGIPNAAFGLAYYPLVALGVALSSIPGARLATLAGASAAAALSLYLAFSLLFVTRRACPYCWLGHACNWVIWIALVRASP